MRVTFVLPHATNVPIGGYKAVYEFSNGLVEMGHKVSIVLPWVMDPLPGLANALKSNLRPLMYRFRPPIKIDCFRIDPRVNLIICSDLSQRWVPDADFVVATSWATARFVLGYGAAKGKKLYLVQHLETFGGPPDEVVATWKMPLQKLTISKWLSEFAVSLGQTSIPIRVGVDLDEFGSDAPIAGRKRIASMLYGKSEVKAGDVGLKALAIVRRRLPDLQVRLFGNDESPTLPEWMTYERSVPASRLRQIYNESAVFVHPSISEGWPAPPVEAMACGAAVAGAENPGFMDYAKPGETALTCAPGDYDALAERIHTLLTNDVLRESIAAAGLLEAQRHSWSAAQAVFLQTLQRLR